ncbi:hypothetical protein HaLaN_00877, partial [Haematococcus lacustris]
MPPVPPARNAACKSVAANATNTDLLLAVVLVASAFAGAGVSQGWAYAEKNLVDPHAGSWVPAVTVKLQIGWWNTTSLVEAGFMPSDVE